MADSLTYRWAIKKDATFFYYVDGNNEVKTTATPYYYEDGIHNWDEIGVSDIRKIDKGGFIRNYADSHQFTGKLAKILRHIYYTEGFTGGAIFKVQRQKTDGTDDFEDYFESDINFNEFDHERDQVQAPLVERGVRELLKSRESVKYEYNVSGNGLRTVKIQPFKTKGFAKYLMIHQNVTAGNETQGNQSGNTYAMPSIAVYDEEFIEVEGLANSRPFNYPQDVSSRAYIKGQQILAWQLAAWNTQAGSYQNFLMHANTDLTNVRVQSSIDTFIKNNDGANALTITAELWEYDTAIPNSEQLIPGMQFSTVVIPASGQGNYNFTIDGTFNIPEGKRLYILFRASGTVQYEYNWSKDTKVNITYEYYTSEFTVQGLTVYEVLSRLINSITGGQATFASSLLTSQAYNIDCRPDRLLILSGDSIKGKSNPKLKISLRDVLECLDTVLCAGIGVEGSTVRVEEKSYFYKEYNPDGSRNVIAELTPLKEPPKFKHSGSLMYHNFKIGYEKPDNDDINGDDEFNTTLEFTTFNTVTNYNDENTQTKEVISPLSASGIDLYRIYIKYYVDVNKDTGGANKNFILQYSDNATAGVYDAFYPTQLNSSAFVINITDTDRPINTGITPKRCLIRRAHWEIGFFNGDETNLERYRFAFQTSERTTGFQSKIGTSYTVVEEKSEVLTDLIIKFTPSKTRVFYPVETHLTTKSLRNYNSLRNNNPWGVFSFDIEYLNGLTVYMFPTESHDRAAKSKERDFVGLLAAGNNPIDLINHS